MRAGAVRGVHGCGMDLQKSFNEQVQQIAATGYRTLHQEAVDRSLWVRAEELQSTAWVQAEQLLNAISAVAGVSSPARHQSAVSEGWELKVSAEVTLETVVAPVSAIFEFGVDRLLVFAFCDINVAAFGETVRAATAFATTPSASPVSTTWTTFHEKNLVDVVGERVPSVTAVSVEDIVDGLAAGQLFAQTANPEWLAAEVLTALEVINRKLPSEDTNTDVRLIRP